LSSTCPRGIARSWFLTSLLAGVFPPVVVEAEVPSGFSDTLVTSVGAPTALAFTPDGRLLITTQPGSLRVYQTGALLPVPALSFPSSSICTNSERGLLGVAVDPSFATNHYIYLYYTFNKFGACPTGNPTAANNPVNRVSRFILPDGNVIDPASETVLLDNMPSPNGNHNGGDLQFGRDGYLYASIGDGGADYAGDSGAGGANDAARDENILLGKVLRITTDGGIPPTNPFQGADADRCNVSGRTTAGRRCRETFAWGLRNPFRIAFDPGAVATRFFVNDVGQNAWEEIDLGQPGTDYGWNCREGAHTNSSSGKCSPTPQGMVDPLFEYAHGATVPGTTSPTNCDSITGGAFVPAGSWPTAYDGSYLFADYVCGWIFRRSPGGAVSDFATNLGGSSAVELRFGPGASGQALYYTTYAAGGQVRRIEWTGSANRAPTAVLSASPTSGAAPLFVSFDASGSSDPDPGNTLTYVWDFGDGSPVAQTATPTESHTYASIGVFSAVLRVRDNLGATSDPAVAVISPGNSPPVPVIVSPAPGDRFRVGQAFTLTGSATDPQDGTLPPSALTWVVILHHNDHIHPFLGPVDGNDVPFTAPPPEDLQATETSYLEIRLTATDSAGLSATATQDLLPNRVSLTFATQPPGLVVLVNGTSLTGPQTIVSWEAWDLAVNAPDQYDAGGRDYVFQSWSDGGAQGHTITTPASDTSYTATFVLRPFSPCLNEVTVIPDGRVTGAALAPAATQWFVVATQAGHSYSAEAQASVGTAAPGSFAVFRGDDGCSGVSTAGARDTTAIDPRGGGAVRLSFTAAGADRNYRLRLTNSSGSSASYGFSVAETTLFSPAWTTNGLYDTYYSLQNTTGSTITATLTLFRTDGTSVGSISLPIPVGATASTNTVALLTPRNATGTARLTHDGPPGAVLAAAAIANFSTSPAYVQPVRFRSVRESR
jgi:glucose/arabinose dehydrogenase